MSFKGITRKDLLPTELTSVKRLREGGPGSGRHPGKGSKQEKGKDKGEGKHTPIEKRSETS